MGEMDCDEVLERLWAYLDGEDDETSHVDLRIHIERCLHCRDHADFEARLRQIIQAKCRGERAPDYLRANLIRLLGWTP
ncbi:MAG: mycothiol system anti-sigma-R factor [Armatimonadota bacterium]|nr:mycothiol system anti-sigma-R factor [Armatimonadota bacterium]MDR7518428.1 mycothiol system anti-sigma-R factor [Armatimonadota bacterium]MDR7549336.1 mycothiol system anti-sigma-R factor [Armatimonadota bacterium]